MTTLSLPPAEQLDLTPRDPQLAAAPKPPRITSIDAARGFVMLTMIFVNDFSSVPKSIGYWWMYHMGEQEPPVKIQDGMTFVDMVFPAFMFLVGMAIPFAIGNRLKKGETALQILPHILIRTLSLLLLGALMVNGENGPNHATWLSQEGWCGLMFFFAILAFIDIRPRASLSSENPTTKNIALWTMRTLVALGLFLFLYNTDAEGHHGFALPSRWITAAIWLTIWATLELLPQLAKNKNVSTEKNWKIISWSVRLAGLLGLLILICLFAQNETDDAGKITTQHLISWQTSPTFFIEGHSHYNPWFLFRSAVEWFENSLTLRTDWGGILGLIAWAYFAGAAVYLLFRNSRLPLAITAVLMMGLYNTKSLHSFALPGFLAPLGEQIAWSLHQLQDYVFRGFDTSGAIVLAGTILATVLVTPDTTTTKSRIKFSLWFILATTLLAILFYKPYLIWKDAATPAWSLWACVFTATLWLLFYLIGDVLKWTVLTKPFALAGENVLLAYLLSEGIVGWTQQAHLGDWWDSLGTHNLFFAILRSLLLGVFLLALSTRLNRAGIRLKL